MWPQAPSGDVVLDERAAIQATERAAAAGAQSRLHKRPRVLIAGDPVRRRPRFCIRVPSASAGKEPPPLTMQLLAVFPPRRRLARRRSS